MDTHSVIKRPESPHSFSREGWERERSRLAIGYHLTMRLTDDGAIARTPVLLRLASDIVLRNGKERGLVCHRFADTHLHVILQTHREAAGMFARCAEGGLRKVLGLRAPFERCRIRPIEDERHLRHAVRYNFCQEHHHGTAFDEAHDGSSLVDLLGLRLGHEWVAQRFAAALPRVTRKIILGWVGLPDLDSGDLNVGHLREAAAAAFGVGHLGGRTAPHARARRVAVHVFDRLVPRTGASLVLGIPRNSVTRYRADVVSDVEVRAVERQLRLREHLMRQRATDHELIR